MPSEPPPELAALSLGEIAEMVAARKLPPVEGWAPQRAGDSEMRIAADGKWYHRGGEITRAAMMRAFSTLLTRNEAGQHWLVSPFEKLTIAVDDAAFIATDLSVADGSLAFRLNTDDLVTHLRVRDGRGGLVKGLRVVDASVMPLITSGNTNSPTLMMAEKAARWIVQGD